MAEGFAKSLAGQNAEIFSAGSKPAGFVAKEAVHVMRESGIDISNHKSKGLSQIPQERYDTIVTMGCGDACPQIAAARRFDWQIPDPMGGTVETFRKARTLVETQVRGLLKEILSETSKHSST